MAGKRLWDMQSRLTITIGPLSHITFETLLPGGSAFERLRQLIEAYVPPSQNVELRYLIDDTERRALGNDLQLGRTAWLHGSGLRHARLPLGSRTTHPWNASRKGILDDGIRTTDQENVAGVPATV
jgi:type VI secretion system protein ImpH